MANMLGNEAHLANKNNEKQQDKIAFTMVSHSFWRKREKLLALATILAVTFLVYLPSLQSGFVNWDDQIYIYKNPYITKI